METGINKRHLKILIAIFIGAIACLIVGFATHYVSAALPRDRYADAKKALDKGDYVEADKLLRGLDEYADAGEIREEIEDEMDMFFCLDMVKEEYSYDKILQVYTVEKYDADKETLVISYGVPGENGDTIAYRAVFVKADEYKLFNSPFIFEDGDIKKKTDIESFEYVLECRNSYSDCSKVKMSRVNKLLDEGVEVEIR